MRYFIDLYYDVANDVDRWCLVPESQREAWSAWDCTGGEPRPAFIFPLSDGPSMLTFSEPCIEGEVI